MAAFFVAPSKRLGINTLQFNFDGGLSIHSKNVMSKYAVHTLRRTWIFKLWNCSNETFPWWCAHTKTHNSPFQIYFRLCIEFVSEIYCVRCNTIREFTRFSSISECTHSQGTVFVSGNTWNSNGAQSACSFCVDELKIQYSFEGTFPCISKHDAIRWKVNEFLIDFPSN